MKTLTALALAATVITGFAANAAGMTPQGRMAREVQMINNQAYNGAMVGMGPLSAEGNQNLMYYFGGPCACPPKPVCEAPCAPVCEKPCDPCAPVCEAPCAPACEPVCPPKPCTPLCCQDFRGWFDGYQCPCPTKYVAEVPCGC